MCATQIRTSGPLGSLDGGLAGKGRTMTQPPDERPPRPDEPEGDAAPENAPTVAWTPPDAEPEAGRGGRAPAPEAGTPAAARTAIGTTATGGARRACPAARAGYRGARSSAPRRRHLPPAGRRRPSPPRPVSRRRASGWRLGDPDRRCGGAATASRATSSPVSARASSRGSSTARSPASSQASSRSSSSTGQGSCVEASNRRGSPQRTDHRR